MDQEYIAKVLSCIRDSEFQAYRVYMKLSSLPFLSKEISITFRYIARESQNHGLFIEELMSLLNLSYINNACRDVGGTTYDSYKKLDELYGREIRGLDNVIEILNLLNNVETVAGEEIYTALVLPLLAKSVENELISEIIHKVKSDENIHRYLVELSRKFINR